MLKCQQLLAFLSPDEVGEVGGYSFGVVRSSFRPFRPSVLPSVRPSTLFVCAEPNLSTYWSDLIHSWYK